MQSNSPLPSLVIPCYNEEEVLDVLIARISEVTKTLVMPVELVLVDDGSSDATWSIICRYQQQSDFIKGVQLSRNFGHQIALTCGLDQARGDVVIILDADLQDPPELIPKMLEKWGEGYDVVYGKRSSRIGESIAKRFFAFAFYRLISQIIKLHIPEDTGDFRLMDRRAVRALLELRERHRFIRGMVSWIGFNQTPIYYERPQRHAGVTKYPFKKSLVLAFDAITSFSYAPLRLASYLGIAISGFAFIYVFVVIALKFAGINFPGYTSLMASILLLGGVQLIVLGLIGEYVGRIFEQGQSRPLYLVQDVRGEPFSTKFPSGN